MKTNKHHIKQKVWNSKWYKWIALVLFILFLFCIFLKCCTPNKKGNQIIDNDEVQNNSSNAGLGSPSGLPNHGKVINPIPIQRRQRRVIDPGRIVIIPDDPLNRRAINNLVNVYLKNDIDIVAFSTSTQRRLSNYNLVPVDTAEVYKRIQFEVDKNEKKAIMSALKEDTTNVKFVTDEWVYQRSSTSVNSDPGYADKKNTWFYEKIGVFEAWKYTKGSSDIKIAVLDDGFDLNHKELRNKYTIPWNVVSYSNNVYGDKDLLFHGTHVAGSIVAEANNNFGISGVAPESIFIPIQIADRSGYITISYILDGIFYALKNNADIINLSFGMSMGSLVNTSDTKSQIFIRDHLLKDEEQLWNEVFDIAKSSNTIIVQAAGNEHLIAGIDPMKRSANSIVVGAINENLNKTKFTNYGTDVTVYAPGKQIYSALPNNNMGYLDGTSMSSPIVAGCIALIKAYRPQMSASEIINLVKTSTSQNKHQVIDLNKIFNELL